MKANTSGLAQNFSIIISSLQEFIPLSLLFLELAYAQSVLTAHSESDWHNEISQVICNSTKPKASVGATLMHTNIWRHICSLHRPIINPWVGFKVTLSHNFDSDQYARVSQMPRNPSLKKL